MGMMAKAGALAAALLLAACSSDGDDPAQGRASPAAASLCVSSDCGSKTVLAAIPDAENLLFSGDGRLFVSGGRNVYEIRADGSGYRAEPLAEASCNFTGLAILRDVLYANCFSGELYAARLSATPRLQRIHDYAIAAPNGLVDGPDGELYAVNGPLAGSALPDGRIVRLTLDPQDPLKVMSERSWYADNLPGPNGLQRQGRNLYVSNSGPDTPGEIRRIEIGADGAPGAAARIARLDAIPDDFSLLDDGLLVTHFVDGRIVVLAADGSEIARSAPLSFNAPSQVRTGQPPLFAPTDLLVTEKGAIGEQDSAQGNVLSLYRRR